MWRFLLHAQWMPPKETGTGGSSWGHFLDHSARCWFEHVADTTASLLSTIATLPWDTRGQPPQSPWSTFTFNHSPLRPWWKILLASTMLFSLRELVQWLGFATFELFLHLLALFVFSMLVALRADMFTNTLSWWLVFVPLFAADGLSTYFTAIVSIRLYQENEKRLAVLRLLWVLLVLSLKLVCEVLLCQKLAEQEQARDLWFGLIVSPLFILLQLLMIRACRVNWGTAVSGCAFMTQSTNAKSNLNIALKM